MNKNTTFLERRKGLGAALLTAALAFLPFTACAVHTHTRGRVVTVEAGHVHSTACGHYMYNNRWYYVSNHVHGPGCGHDMLNGVWVVVR